MCYIVGRSLLPIPERRKRACGTDRRSCGNVARLKNRAAF